MILLYTPTTNNSIFIRSRSLLLTAIALTTLMHHSSLLNHIINTTTGKSADDADYSAKQAHVELAMRMRKRDAGSAPNVGK